MAKPSLIYFAADADRNLWIEITKDLDLALMVSAEELGRPLRIVRVEQFDTIREAITRMRSIRKMSIPRRRRLVERLNPGWRHVAVEVRVPVTPTGAEVPAPMLPPIDSSYMGPPYRVPRSDDDTSGGVPARISAPVGPRAGRDAKPHPPNADA
ncbi:MAG: hypothetical protein ACHQ50_06010 [Fimbriimonadales bacterium]